MSLKLYYKFNYFCWYLDAIEIQNISRLKNASGKVDKTSFQQFIFKQTFDKRKLIPLLNNTYGTRRLIEK